MISSLGRSTARSDSRDQTALWLSPPSLLVHVWEALVADEEGVVVEVPLSFLSARSLPLAGLCRLLSKRPLWEERASLGARGGKVVTPLSPQLLRVSVQSPPVWPRFCFR